MKEIISLLTLAISGVVLAQSPEVATYYQGVDFNLNGLALKNQLANKITSTHESGRILIYNQTWDALKITDANSNNTSQVVLLYGWENGTDNDYTNDLYRNNTLQDPGREGEFWNREHTYARSLGTPNLETNSGGISGLAPNADAHHLRAADKERNANRGNLLFAAGSGNSKTVSGGWYPGDQWKGDVARMMMYMYVRYGTRCLPTNVGVGSPANTPDAMIDLFLNWNAQDPVSEIEIQRNNYLANANNEFGQGNRNPFIDNPYLATKIWGGTPAQDTWGTLSLNPAEPIVYKVKIYPNPSNGNFVIQSQEVIKKVIIYNLSGQIIQNKNTNETTKQFQVTDLSTGVYLVSVETNSYKETRKIVIN